MFAIGFVLGTVRVLLVVPRLGECTAVLLELPVMLASSWLVCRWIVGKLALTTDLSARLSMGGVAFILLMLAEACVSVFVFERSIAEHMAGYANADRLMGFAAQVVFASMPLIHSYMGSGAVPRATDHR